MTSAGVQQQFHIRWNNHKSILHSVIRRHLIEELFVDVTLACEGKSIKCHRIVLSASSDYFEKILLENSEPHVVIYITDVKVWELQALVTFMYNGQLQIDQKKLPALIKAAECLKIKGLASEPHVETDEYLPSTGIKEEPNQKKEESILKVSSLQKSSFRPPPPLSQGKPLLKRKGMAPPPAALPKLVKMEGAQKQPNGGDQLPAIIPNEKPTAQLGASSMRRNSKSGGGSVSLRDNDDDQIREYEKEEGEEGEDILYENEPSTEDDDCKDVEEDMEQDADERIEEDDGNSENDTQSGSENDEAANDSPTSPRRYKYGKDIKDSALSALNSGVSLRQCSEAFGIPRKTLSKWKNQDLRNSALMDDTGDYEESLMVRRPGLEAGDRAERLQKAMELAMNGTTVRQAAAHYDIPRTTLCAYMKRRGVAPKRNFLPIGGIPGLPPPQSRRGNPKQSGDGGMGQPSDFPFGLSDFLDELNGE